MLTDSHCHLDFLDLKLYAEDLSKAIAAARAKDVNYILCPGVDIEHFPDILKIAETDKNIFAAVGLHPTEKESHEPSLDELLTLGQNKKVVGIGETGLDFYYAHDEIERNRQKKIFKMQVQVAKNLGKPLIIHARDAEQDIIKILIEEEAMVAGGVLHCFTGTQGFAQKLIDLGFYISFSGIVTFRNADSLRAIAQAIPLDRILIETDAPYLTPVPVRGKPNEPAYLPYIAEFIAKLRGISYESFAKQTTENFLRLCLII